MKVHHLRPAEGSKRERTRKGRGISAGKGKTAGRGTKGWGARHTPKLGFEIVRCPTRSVEAEGFLANRQYSVVNVGELGKIFPARVRSIRRRCTSTDSCSRGAG